jgi:hypothetical protein
VHVRNNRKFDFFADGPYPALLGSGKETDAAPIAAASPPSPSLERDFRRRRLARQKGPEDDVSAQRPEIGDHHTREMAAKTAFLLANYQLRVSTDGAAVWFGLEAL